MDKLTEKQPRGETIDTINAIKAEATITFSLELQSRVQQQLNEFNTKTILKTPSTQECQSHVPPTAKYWTKTMHHTAAQTCREQRT
jgi:hypothetical protein